MSSATICDPSDSELAKQISGTFSIRLKEDHFSFPTKSVISNPKVDTLYESAMQAGARGGKLLGAGGGGFLLFYVEPEKQEAVRKAMTGLQEVEFHVTRYGSRVVYFA